MRYLLPFLIPSVLFAAIDANQPAVDTAINTAYSQIRANFAAIDANLPDWFQTTSQYGSTAAGLNDANDAADSGGWVLIDSVCIVDSSVTFDNPVAFVPGGYFDISDSVTVTFNGALRADLSQKIFEIEGEYPITGYSWLAQDTWAAGVVRLASDSCPYVSPKWWGAAGDGVTDDYTEFSACSDTAGYSGISMWIPPGTYKRPEIVLHSGGYDVYGNGALLIPGDAQDSPLLIGEHPYAGSTQALYNRRGQCLSAALTVDFDEGDYTCTTADVNGISAGDWVFVQSGASTFSSVSNHIPMNFQYMRVASATATQLTFDAPSLHDYAVSDTAKVIYNPHLCIGRTVQGLRFEGAFDIAHTCDIRASINTTIKDCLFYQDASFGACTFSDNLLYEHIKMRGYGGMGSGRGTVKVVYRDCYAQNRADNPSTWTWYFEEEPYDITIDNCVSLGGILAYSNSSRTDVVMKIVNSYIKNTASCPLFFATFQGIAHIYGNTIIGEGLADTSGAFKGLIHIATTGSDADKGFFIHDNVFESLSSDCMLFTQGTASTATQIHFVNNKLVNVIGNIDFDDLSSHSWTTNGNVGIETLYPSYTLSLGGGEAQTIGMERQPAYVTNPGLIAGNNLTIQAGGCATGLISTVDVNDGGTGYVVGDLLYVTAPEGGLYAILDVNTVVGGVVTVVDVNTTGTNYTAGLYTTLTDSNGVGCAVDVTAVVSGTNAAGGYIILKPGISSGTGISGVDIYGLPAGASGVVENAPVLMMRVTGDGIYMFNLPSGATEPAGADANELWLDTDDQTIKLGT